MVNSINTNQSAMVALQSLNRTADQLQTVQKRISTGYKVADAKDDGAAFAVAQSIRSTASAYGSVNTGISQARGAVEVATVAATGLADKLGEARSVLTKLADSTLSTGDRDVAQKQYAEIRTAIQDAASQADYNGFNALGSKVQNVVTSVDGGTYAIGGLKVKESVEALSTEVKTAEDAQAMLASDGAFTRTQGQVSDAINTLGTDARRLGAQMQFNSAVEDSRTASLGAVVDADLARESANLQSLQVKQQLASQSLGIANQAPQILQSLFR